MIKNIPGFLVLFNLLFSFLQPQEMQQASFADGRTINFKVLTTDISKAPDLYLGGSPIGLNAFTSFHHILDAGFSVYAQYVKNKTGFFATFSKPYSNNNDYPYAAALANPQNSVSTNAPSQYYNADAGFLWYFANKLKTDSLGVTLGEGFKGPMFGGTGTRIIYLVRIPAQRKLQRGLRFGYYTYRQTINRGINPDNLYLSTSGRTFYDSANTTSYSVNALFIGYSSRQSVCIELETDKGEKRKTKGEVMYYVDLVYCPKINFEKITVNYSTETFDISPTFITRTMGFRIGMNTRYLFNKSANIARGYGIELGMRPDIVQTSAHRKLNSGAGKGPSALYFNVKFNLYFCK